MKLFILIAITALSLNSFAGNTKELPKIELMESAISLDIDQDGKLDLAFLTTADFDDAEYLTLWVKLFGDTDYFKFGDISLNNNGGMYGVGSQLQANDSGSLQVYSYNEAIGRSRWSSTITIAYRKNALVLAGFTYSERDTLDLSNSTCDINLLSKKGEYESTLNESTGKATFDVSPSDVLRLENASYDNLINTYLNNYCNTFDIHEEE